MAVDVLSDRPDPGTRLQLFETRGPLRYATEIGRRLGLLETAELIHQSANLMTHRLAEYALQLYPPDVLLQPRVGQVGLFAFDLAPEAYQLGEAAARAALPRLEGLARPHLTSPTAWRMQLAADWRRHTLGKPYRR